MTHSGDWYEDHSNLAALARHLFAGGSSADEVIAFLEKPWHWDTEWTAYRMAVKLTTSPK